MGASEHCPPQPKSPAEKEFGEFMQQALAKQSKYPACQECKWADAGKCDPECMDAVARDATEKNSQRSPSDRIMKTIRDEVNESLCAAKLSGYRQAQREELDFLFNHLHHAEDKKQRVNHLRKELGLGIIKNR